MIIDKIIVENVDEKIHKVTYDYKTGDTGTFMNLSLEFLQVLDSMTINAAFRSADKIKPGVYDPELYKKELFKNNIDVAAVVNGKKGNFIMSTVTNAFLKMFKPQIKFPLPIGTYNITNIEIPSPIQFKLNYFNWMKYNAIVGGKKYLISEWKIFGRYF
jgi:hypothetical protein